MRMRTRLVAFFLIAFLLFPATTRAATYYVRTDGGPADRCTGLADAAALPSGSGLPCAWDHPFRALPPGGPARIVGGDTLQIGPDASHPTQLIGAGAGSGCVETWPGGQPAGCWGQSAGGYGDGVATGDTAGTWVFEDSAPGGRHPPQPARSTSSWT